MNWFIGEKTTVGERSKEGWGPLEDGYISRGDHWGEVL